MLSAVEASLTSAQGDVAFSNSNQAKAGQRSAAEKKLIACSRSLEAAPRCQESKIRMVTPGSNPKITQGN
jgi:hypothetical protein